MSRSSRQGSGSQRSVFASLLAPVVLVAIAGLIGWLVLITVKWLVVAILIALGVALILVPIFLGRRIASTAVGGERTHRIAQLATAVVLGIALIVVAITVAHHGWLLIVVPAAIVLIGRLVGRVSSARADRRERSFH